MEKNRRLSKCLAAASLGGFLLELSYKAEMYGVKVSRRPVVAFEQDLFGLRYGEVRVDAQRVRVQVPSRWSSDKPGSERSHQ